MLIYGDQWPDCCAMEAIIRKCSLESVRICDSISALLLGLSASPKVGLILCLRPHEHVYLFYRLRHWLKNRKLLVVMDKMYYTDRCVMQYFGVKYYLERDELLPLISRKGPARSDAETWRWFRHSREDSGLSHPPDMTEPGGGMMAENILFLLNQYIRWNIPAGVSDSKYSLLLLLSSGCPAVLLARKMRMHPRTVSIYRWQAMSRLNMKSSPVSLFRGVRLLAQLQRTPFMSEYGDLSEKAGVTLTTGETN